MAKRRSTPTPKIELLSQDGVRISVKKESESHRLFIARGFTVADAEETPDLVVVTTEPEPKEEEKIIDPQNPWDIMSLDEMKEYLRGQGVSFGNSGEKRLRELVKQSFTGE